MRVVAVLWKRAVTSEVPRLPPTSSVPFTETTDVSVAVSTLGAVTSPAISVPGVKGNSGLC